MAFDLKTLLANAIANGFQELDERSLRMAMLELLLEATSIGAGQTPWTSDINANGFSLYAANDITAGSGSFTALTVNGNPVGGQTPWLSDIDGGGNSLTNIASVATTGGATNNLRGGFFVDGGALYGFDGSGVAFLLGLTVSNQAALGGGAASNDDIEILSTSKGFIQPSPDGTRWRITVANDGTLSTVLA